jgi:LCP family protein required for cell wall assembly
LTTANKKEKNEILSFLTTFIAAFVIVLAITTPTMAWMNKALESTPFDGGNDEEDAEIPILEMMMDYLIPDDSPFFDAFTNTKRVNIIAMGVDEFNLTDTIILGSFDTVNKRVDLIWIPRDTYYYRGPGYIDAAHHKINAIFRGSPVNTAKAVSEILLDMPINYYVMFSYDGVKNIIDSMGGVPMDIPFDMKYRDPLDTPPLVIDLKKGEQILNGEQSVQFLRYRSGYKEGDLGRVAAQQQFMKNALKQCLSLDLPKIADTAFDNITSDMNLKTMLFLVSKAIGVSADNITTYTLPGWADPDPPYFIYPREREIAKMLTEIYFVDETIEEPVEE